MIMGGLFSRRRRSPPPPPKRPLPPPAMPTPTPKPVPQKTRQELLVEEARTKLNIDVVMQYNFAFVGLAGCGKSSLINALRKLDDEAPGAARVGEVDTTKTIQKYTDPSATHVALWDFPGAGTKGNSEDIYFEKNMLYAFDCILVLSADRFLAVDFQIARQAIQYKRPCAFIRTKADESLKSIVRRKYKSMLEASKDLRHEVNASFEENLAKCGLFSQRSSYKLFIVSAWAIVDDSTYVHGDDRSLEGMDENECMDFVFKSTLHRST